MQKAALLFFFLYVLKLSVCAFHDDQTLFEIWRLNNIKNYTRNMGIKFN